MWLHKYFLLLVLHYFSVNASDCREKPPHCKVNEVWNCSCLPQPTCDDPCAERDEPHVCPLGPDGNCVKKCICKPGFVRRSDGLCTHCTQCTQLDEGDCCDDEEYQECGTFCPETCASHGKTDICTEQCVQGCFCKKGQVRDINGTCVDPEECRICGNNETYTDCGSGCDYTCANYGDPIACGAVCIKGCFCNKGYHRNDAGQCILLKDCPPRKCDESEYFSTCGPRCQPYCKDLGTDDDYCKEKTCKWGCFCKKGFYLNNRSDKCIALKNCQAACPDGEIFKTCGTACQPYCADPSPICTKQCSRSCFCPDGYIRENKGGFCIKKGQCPN